MASAQVALLDLTGGKRLVPKTIIHQKDDVILKKEGYTLGREIGSGTFSKVLSAQWTDGEKKIDVAAKMIDTQFATKEFIGKFLPRELAIWPKLTHQNIIQVYSVIRVDHRTYMFMELGENKDVLEYLHRHGVVDESLARKWISQLVCALKFCHSKGVAHRDLKCENLLLDKNYNIKLTDFGFSRLCWNKLTRRNILSETYCGSAAYVAPEVLRGSPYNPLLGDVWSMGVCLYVMLNNDMPFDDTNLMRMYRHQVNRKWNFKEGVEQHLSSHVKYLIKRTLEPDIFKRFNLDLFSRSAWLNQPLTV